MLPPSPVDSIDLIATSVGRPAFLGQHGRLRVHSGINKQPLPATVTSTYLGEHGLADDKQADGKILKGHREPVHGGLLKAVYAYPFEHYLHWAATLDRALAPGAFGENLTVDGVNEKLVRLGEIWQWGDALLQVTGVRRPCFKLDMHRGKGTAKLMIETGRCGWYLKVLRPGEVPTTGTITVVERWLSSASMAEIFSDKKLTVADIPGPHGDD